MAFEGFTRPGVDRFHFLTVTPQGDELHCKKAGCKAAPFCPHEKCACTPLGGVDLAEWNPTAARRWNRLLLLMERHYGVRPVYFRGVEPQDGKRRVDGVGRGGLHFHVLVRTPYAIDERTFRVLAIEAGFGHSVDVEPVDQGSRALVRYVTKRVAGYASKAADLRGDVPWRREVIDYATGEVETSTKPTYRTWSQSRAWGTTMREIRRRASEKAAELNAQRLAGVPLNSSSAPPAPVATESPPAPS